MVDEQIADALLLERLTQFLAVAIALEVGVFFASAYIVLGDRFGLGVLGLVVADAVEVLDRAAVRPPDPLRRNVNGFQDFAETDLAQELLDGQLLGP